MAHKKLTSRPMTEKEKQVAKRKLHKAELEGVRALIKDGMKISVDEIIEAIEKAPNGQLALQFFMDMDGTAIVDSSFLHREKGETDDHWNEKQEAWKRVRGQYYSSFYMGLVTGVTEYKNFYEKYLKTLREIKEQDDKAASDVAASK